MKNKEKIIVDNWICRICKNDLLISKFGINKSTITNYSFTCKECTVTRDRIHRKGNADLNIINIDDLEYTIDGVSYKERWMPINVFEEYYLISDLGRVKTLYRRIFWENRGYQDILPRILKPDINHLGYHRVSLANNGKSMRIFVHRLVAEHFIPRMNKKQNQVNHIEGIKSDNRFFKLEWVTCSENRLHAIHVLKIKVSGGTNLKGSLSRFAKKVICINTNTTYNSVIDASAELNIPYSSITSNCRGIMKSVRGYVFKYIK